MFGFPTVIADLSAARRHLDPEAFHRPPTDTWPTYNGDYSGRRYSTLSQINASNVNTLGLVWTHHVDFGSESYAQQASEGRRIKATPLLVDGVLYFTITDNVWAMDALPAGSYGTMRGRTTGRSMWPTGAWGCMAAGCISCLPTTTWSH